jgi:replication factor C subunit 2/4
MTMDIWTEKYRPMKTQDLLMGDSMRRKFEEIIQRKSMPNIILTGEPGVGKTTTILCLCHELLGDRVNDGVLELNASDNRGIKSIQVTLTFCKKTFDQPNPEYAKHKIIIYDEADNITQKAQTKINSMMESFNDTTKFAFTCNNSSDIIESIQSRCMIIRYPRIESSQLTRRLMQICIMEKIDYDEEGIQIISDRSNGDMRKAINNLQLTYVSHNYVKKECMEIDPVDNLLLLCKQKKLREALSYQQVLLDNGSSVYDIVKDILNHLKTDVMREDIRIQFFNLASQSMLVLSKGIESPLQLTSLICRLCNV